MSPDVLVVGGGAAGIAAAVAAASAGARTALVESAGMLGGNATGSLLGTVCGLYVTGADGRPSFANDGFARDFAERLRALPGCGEPIRRGRVFVLPYAPFAFAWLADRFVADESAVDLRLHTHCVGVEAGGRRVEAVRLAGPEGLRTVPVGAVVDATGDAVVAYAAGAAVAAGAEAQPPALVFVLQDVDTRALEGPRAVAALRALSSAVEAGRLPPGAERLAFAPTAHAGELVVKLTVPAPDDSRDPLAAAAVRGRRLVAEIVRFLAEEQPAFRAAFLSHVAPRLGVRETRRLAGRACLTREDVLGARRREDAVARGAWPIELWSSDGPGPTYEYPPDGGTYDIPEGCLAAREVDNLFAAGRCLSATHEAMGSARVIGTALATGEAAGRMAARAGAAR